MRKWKIAAVAVAVVAGFTIAVAATEPAPDRRPLVVADDAQYVTDQLLDRGWRGDPIDGMEALYAPGCLP